MRIILTGPRSVGKTSIGKELASQLNLKYVEGDKVNDELPNIYQFISLFNEDNFLYDLVGGFFVLAENHPPLKEKIMEMKNYVIIVGLLPFQNPNKSTEVLIKRERNREHFQDLSLEEITNNTLKHYKLVSENIPQYCDKIFYTEDKSIQQITEEIKDYISNPN